MIRSRIRQAHRHTYEQRAHGIPRTLPMNGGASSTFRRYCTIGQSFFELSSSRARAACILKAEKINKQEREPGLSVLNFATLEQNRAEIGRQHALINASREMTRRTGKKWSLGRIEEFHYLPGVISGHRIEPIVVHSEARLITRITIQLVAPVTCSSIYPYPSVIVAYYAHVFCSRFVRVCM